MSLESIITVRIIGTQNHLQLPMEILYYCSQSCWNFL